MLFNSLRIRSITTLCCTAALTLMLCSPIHAEQYSLMQDKVKEGWYLNAGSVIPPENLGELRELAGNEGYSSGIQLQYLFQPGVNYIGMRAYGEWKQTMQRINFDVESETETHGIFTLKDASGEAHMARWQTSAGTAQTVTLPLNAETFSQNWAGDKNGIVDYPIKSITVGVSRMSPQRGIVNFSNFSYQTSQLEEPVNKATLSVTSNAPSSVFTSSNSEKLLNIAVHNPRAGQRQLTIDVDYQFNDLPKQKDTFQVTIGARSTEIIEYQIDEQDAGYVALNIAVLDNGKILDQSPHAIAIVPKPSRPNLPFEDTFYGMSFMKDMEASYRMGARFVRELIHWKFVEMRPGQYYTAEMDELLEGASGHGVGVILTAVVRESPEWAPFDTPAGFLEGNNKLYLTQFLKKIAERMRLYQIDGAIEVQNEPDIALMWLHKMELEQASEVASFILRESYIALKQMDPERRTMGLGMSGMDFRNGLELTKRVTKKVPFHADYYSPHPYTLKRFLAEGKEVEWPDSGYLMDYWQQMYDIAKDTTIGGELWSTELGWAVELDTPLLSDNSLNLAAILSQAMILSKVAEGVERFTWFAGQLQWYNEGYDYSLFRKHAGDWYPTPGVNAFAVTADMLETARFVRELDLHPNLHAYFFTDAHTNNAVIALWSKNGEITISGNGGYPFRISNLFGNERKAGKSFTQTVGRAPVFFRSAAWQAGKMLNKVQYLTIK